MKKIFLLFFSFCLLILFQNQIQAVSTNKAKMPFEITSITVNQTEIIVKGWGMLYERHHFNSKKTHYYELILTSDHHKKVYRSNPSYDSKTSLVEYVGVRKCKANEYNQPANICNYNYDYAGFTFRIPLNDLQIGTSYSAQLKVISNVFNTSHTAYVFYPTVTPLRQINGNIEYKLISSLYDTQLKVTTNAIFDRKSPSKNSKIHQSTKICNWSYAYDRYFNENSIYKKVYDRKTNENTTYYKVKTSKQTICVGGRNVIKEGNDYDSWIATNWVDYSGEPMIITVTDINQPPIIKILQHPTITTKEVKTFNFKSYIQATDPEEGNITYKVIQTNQVDIRKPGNYQLHLKVIDQYGKSDEKILNVTVMDGNQPPVIYAENMTLYQYDEFNYLDNVTAIDEEDGIITHKIRYQGNVNTNQLGTYQVTYTVKDSENKIAQKTIQVQVIRNPKEKLRYIDTKEEKVFFKESIPKNWSTRYPFLIEQLEDPKIFITRNVKI